MAGPRGAARAWVKIEGKDKAKKDLKSVEKAFDDLAKGTGGVNNQLRAMSPAMGAALAGLGAIAAAATAATVALHKMGMRGGDVDAVATAFERIASPQFIRNLEQATGGLVRSTEMMARATMVLRTGLADEAQITRWFQTVTRSAQDMGRDVVASLDAVAVTLAGGGLESLNRLGVNVPEIRERLQEMGLTAESVAGRVEAMNMAMAQLDGTLGLADNSTGNYNDALTALTVTIQNWYDETARALATNEDLVNWFVALKESIQAALPEGEGFGDMIADVVVQVLEFARAGAQVVNVLVHLGVGLGRFLNILQSIANPLLVVSGRTTEIEEALVSLRDVSRSVTGVLTNTSQRFAELREESASAAESLAENLPPLRNMDRILPSVEEHLGDLGDGMDEVAQSSFNASRRMDRLSTVIGTLNTNLSLAERRARSLRQEIGRLREERLEGQGEFRGLSFETGVGGLQGRGGRGDGPDARRGALAQQAFDAEVARQEAEVRRLEELRRRQGRGGGRDLAEEQRELWGEFKTAFQEAQDEMSQSVDEFYQRQIEGLRELDAARQSIADAEEEARVIRIEKAEADHQRKIEMYNELGEAAVKQQEAEEAADQRRNEIMGKSVEGFRSITGSLDGLSNQIVSYMEASGKSAEETAKAQGKYLIAYNTVMAIVEAAAAAASFASQQYVAGAMHVISAATYGVAAATAAAQLGGGSAGGAKAAGSRFTPSREPELESPAEGGGQVIIHSYSLGQSEASMAESMERADWQRMRQGSGTWNPNTVEYDV
jgi:hypothetical protein